MIATTAIRVRSRQRNRNIGDSLEKVQPGARPVRPPQRISRPGTRVRLPPSAIETGSLMREDGFRMFTAVKTTLSPYHNNGHQLVRLQGRIGQDDRHDAPADECADPTPKPVSQERRDHSAAIRDEDRQEEPTLILHRSRLHRSTRCVILPACRTSRL
jgi:hypothetical protein